MRPKICQAFIGKFSFKPNLNLLFQVFGAPLLVSSSESYEQVFGLKATFEEFRSLSVKIKLKDFFCFDPKMTQDSLFFGHETKPPSTAPFISCHRIYAPGIYLVVGPAFY